MLKGLPKWFSGKKSACPMQEVQVWSLGGEDLLEEEMATHSRILTWKIPQTKESGGLQSMGSQRVRHDWVTEHAGTCMWKGKLRHINLKKKVYLSSCWFELDSTKPKVMNNSFALTGARGGVLQRRSKARRLFDWPKLKQLVALFGKAKLAVCSWRLSSFIFSDWSALTLAQVLVCLCFGLLAWGTKALEPIQSHGLLV